ncbi:MAG: glycine zipper 2TM domain-containing protein [Rhodospirillales bacterium]|nr:glycine zipper 2TM domain-containing protein [Rhodospirillales bacterium]
MKRLSVLVLASAILVGCADYGPKEMGGSLIGAGVGGLAGAQFGRGKGQLAATGAGALLGALVGGSAGRSLDRADRLYMSRAAADTFEHVPSGHASRWRNPDSGNWGTITPMRTYETAYGYCREYQQTIVVGGRYEESYGTACRQPDGSWRVVD